MPAGRSRSYARGSERVGGRISRRDPVVALALRIRTALDPEANPRPAPVRTLADMSPEERVEIAILYGTPRNRTA